MKLLRCNKCHDIFKLRDRMKKCECGASSGKYVDDLNAVYKGDCLLLGISNQSLHEALNKQKVRNLQNIPPAFGGVPFTAFTIPENAPTVARLPDKK